jgi:hypothetical protein
MDSLDCCDVRAEGIRARIESPVFDFLSEVKSRFDGRRTLDNVVVFRNLAQFEGCSSQH